MRRRRRSIIAPVFSELSAARTVTVGEPPSDPAVDPADLGQVFRRFAPYVAGIAGRILGRWGEVDDIVQDVFLDAHRGLGTLRDPGAVRRWLATVTVRKARRRLGQRRLFDLIGLDAPVDPLEIPDPTANAEERAHSAAVYRILDRLRPDVRIAWILHRVEAEPLERVAEVCRCSRATAHRRVVEAQAALERGLA
jgi:RNA polymerase sigma-70 factor, ECF subfamily